MILTDGDTCTTESTGSTCSVKQSVVGGGSLFKRVLAMPVKGAEAEKSEHAREPKHGLTISQSQSIAAHRLDVDPQREFLTRWACARVYDEYLASADIIYLPFSLV